MRGRVLITGATGFVGSHLTRHLAAAGVPLTLALRSAERPALPAGDVRFVQVGDIGAVTDWADALVGATAIIHAAAHVHVEPERATAQAALFHEVNVEGTAALFDAAGRAGARLFIFLSSVTVLGDGSSPRGLLTDRSMPDPRTLYAHSKWSAEERLTTASGLYPAMRLVVLRPPLIYGPGVKGNLRALLRAAATPLPLPLGRIRNRRTLLSLETLAAAIDAVLASSAGAGTFLLGDPEPVSTSDIAAALRAGLGRSPRLLPALTTLATGLAHLAGRPGLAARLFKDLELDSSRFRQVFGPIATVDTAASLRDTARAYARREGTRG